MQPGKYVCIHKIVCPGINRSGNCAGSNYAQKKRTDKTGVPENFIINFLQPVIHGVIMPEGKCCSPANNTKQKQEEWNMQVSRYDRIYFGKSHKENYDYNDKPHMIGFPDGSQCA